MEEKGGGEEEEDKEGKGGVEYVGRGGKGRGVKKGAW